MPSARSGVGGGPAASVPEAEPSSFGGEENWLLTLTGSGVSKPIGFDTWSMSRTPQKAPKIHADLG